MITRLAAITLGLILMSNQAVAFEIDLTLGQMKKLDGQVILDDLAVGDKGKVESRAFCFKGKELFLSPQAEIISKSRTEYDIVATIAPGKTASISIQNPNKSESSIERDVLVSALTSLTRRFTCELWDNDVNEGRLISVSEINGKRKLSELTK